MSAVLSDPKTAAPVDALEIVPVAGRIGAEVRGVRLSGQMPAAQFAALQRALLEYRVLFFRDQHHLDDARHEAFAQRFGEIVQHPTVRSRGGTQILELDSHQGGRANSWHTDVTFELAYPKISILRTVELPERGGDTVWANTVAAYQEFPAAMRQFLDTLWAVHGNDFDYAATRVELDDEGAKKYRQLYAARVVKTEHPLVRVHPETGERSLVLGHYAQRFVGYNTQDSDHLYALLQSHITRLENTVRWHWTRGNVAIWDNRATQHYAINDYGDRHRVVRRITVAGEVPISVDGRRSRPHPVPTAQA